MSRFERCLIVFHERAYGGRNSDVGFKCAELEFVVTVGSVFAGDLNALDRDERALLFGDGLILERCCICKEFGVILGSYGGYSGIGDLIRCVFDLMRAAVNVLRTGNKNLHAYFDPRFDGIGSRTVDVVCAVFVFKVETVIATAVGLGDDRRYYTFHDHGVACCGVHIFLPGGNLECGNLVREFNGESVAISILYGCLEGVFDLGLGLFVEGDRYHLFLIHRGDGDCAVVRRPFDIIGNAVNGGHTYYLE